MSTQFTETSVSPNVGDALQRAWTALKPNIWLFLGFTVLFFIGYYILMFLLILIPFGNLLVNVFGFIYPVSLYTAFQACEGGRELEFRDFFNWTPRFGRLFLGSLVLYAIILAIMIPLALIFGVSLMASSSFTTNYSASDLDRYMGIGFGFIGLGLLVGLLYTIATFAFHYLLLKRDLPLGETMATSARTGFRIVGPILLFALLALGLFFVGTIACGVGLLITIPLIIGTQYFMLQDVFPDPAQNNWDFEAPMPPHQTF